MIFISTGGIRTQTAFKTAQDFLSKGILGIELSGGAFQENQLKDLKELAGSVSFRVHNYFPPPKEPFVFNLASFCF